MDDNEEDINKVSQLLPSNNSHWDFNGTMKPSLVEIQPQQKTNLSIV